MKLLKIQKKIAALTLALGIGVVTCGTGAFAAVTRTSYNFSVAVGQKDTTEDVQKTVQKSYASATVTSYGNSTNVDYLRLRVLRSSTAVTGFEEVKGTGNKSLSYTKTVSTGESVKLRGYVAASATYGYGIMSGVFEP
jgi:hypothetical protein